MNKFIENNMKGHVNPMPTLESKSNRVAQKSTKYAGEPGKTTN
jgi:hypothetical protein